MPARAFPPSAPTGSPAPPAWGRACACGLPSASSSAGSRRSTRRAVSWCACPTGTPGRSPRGAGSYPRCPARRFDWNGGWCGPPINSSFGPLGGAGEIGMNLAIYGFGNDQRREWIAVDFGVAFADDALPGIDLIMPDIRYLVEERRNLLGLVLTHAHEDHFGALLDLWPRLKVPV